MYLISRNKRPYKRSGVLFSEITGGVSWTTTENQKVLDSCFTLVWDIPAVRIYNPTKDRNQVSQRAYYL